MTTEQKNINKKTEWKKANLPDYCIVPHTCKCNKLLNIDEYGSCKFIPRSLCHFDKKQKQWFVSYLSHFVFAEDLEKKSADWNDYLHYRATYDQLGEKLDWEDSVLLAYESERKAEKNVDKRREIDKKYLEKYAF